MNYLLTIAISLLFSINSIGQPLIAGNTVRNTEAYSLHISEIKTSSIVFPFDIISVDRGRKDVIIQKAKGVNNILLLKAAKIAFPETNLTVITADGELYPFVINYKQQPDSLHLIIERTGSTGLTSGRKTPSGIAFVQDNLRLLKNKKNSNLRLKASRYGITLDLQGLYVQDDMMYFQFRLRNNSNIDYTTASFSISISDKKQRKRTARQVQEIIPIAKDGLYELVKGKTTEKFIMVVPKFTIPDKKKCIIQLMETNGGRNITIQLGNATIIKTQTISVDK